MAEEKEYLADSSNYVEFAVRTENKDYKAIGERVDKIKAIRLLHAALGLCTEAGEFQDELKRHIFYGKELDEINLAEEIGDTLWYCALALDTIGVSLNSVMSTNILKLKKRYPELFKEADALSRSSEAERTELEKMESEKIFNDARIVMSPKSIHLDTEQDKKDID